MFISILCLLVIILLVWGTIICIHEDSIIERTGSIYNMWEYCSWGHSIRWSNYETKRITGHYRVLYIGDELRCKMQSGKIARFIIDKMEYCLDPSDQFFGHASFIGYVGEPEIVIKYNYRIRKPDNNNTTINVGHVGGIV